MVIARSAENNWKPAEGRVADRIVRRTLPYLPIPLAARSVRQIGSPVSVHAVCLVGAGSALRTHSFTQKRNVSRLWRSQRGSFPLTHSSSSQLVAFPQLRGESERKPLLPAFQLRPRLLPSAPLVRRHAVAP